MSKYFVSILLSHYIAQYYGRSYYGSAEFMSKTVSLSTVIRGMFGSNLRLEII
jgi:hypothetical protein